MAPPAHATPTPAGSKKVKEGAFQSTKPTGITPVSSSQARTPGKKKVMPTNEPIKQTTITPARSSQARTLGKNKLCKPVNQQILQLRQLELQLERKNWCKPVNQFYHTSIFPMIRIFIKS